MQNITFDFLGQHRHGTAFIEYLRLRKSFFVDRFGWEIPHNDEVEMDQYDNPCAHYSLVLRRGKVVGGARAMPTTATWGQHTYMLRDALRGYLSHIPSELMPSDIVSDEVWESSRLVISESVTTQAERTECLYLIFEGLVGITCRHGGCELMGLTRPALMRALRQLGVEAIRLGGCYRNPTDGLDYAVLHMPAMPSAHSIAAE